MKTKMKLERSMKNGVDGKGFVLYGSIEEDISRWFERWFDTADKAERYAAKRGWEIERKS